MDAAALGFDATDAGAATAESAGTNSPRIRPHSS